MQPFNAERGESEHNKTDSKDNKSGGTDTKGASSVWNRNRCNVRKMTMHRSRISSDAFVYCVQFAHIFCKKSQRMVHLKEATDL